ELQWNDFFRKIQTYGNTFINQTAVDELAEKIRDGHMVLHRVIERDIPNWIKDEFKLPIEFLQVFASNPGSIGRTHKDGIARKGSLNIPLLNTDHGYV